MLTHEDISMLERLAEGSGVGAHQRYARILDALRRWVPRPDGFAELYDKDATFTYDPARLVEACVVWGVEIPAHLKGEHGA
jgi:hypothetical protein